MAPTTITTIEKLREYLHVAMAIEHATLPPYLLALYSIKPGTNIKAVEIIRTVVVEEMLHLTLAANMLNAIGGTPNLNAPGFVPHYPAPLPDGEKDFCVDLEPFSKDAIETFLKIERPTPAPSADKKLFMRQATKVAGGVKQHDTFLSAQLNLPPGMDYFSIGEFYDEIVRGFKYLYTTDPDGLFTGDPARQVPGSQYYSGGGELYPVTNLDTALTAAEQIIGQGEGFDHGVADAAGEIAHYYRFDALKRGQWYKPTDTPGKPTGECIAIDWTEVYPFKKNVKLSDYPEGSELHAAANEFNDSYSVFLSLLTTAYNGFPALMERAVHFMRQDLTRSILCLIRNPIPGMQGVNAAPTFEVGCSKPSEGCAE